MGFSVLSCRTTPVLLTVVASYFIPFPGKMEDFFYILHNFFTQASGHFPRQQKHFDEKCPNIRDFISYFERGMAEK